MAQVKVYNQTGKEVETLELADAVFGVDVNPTVVHEVVVAAQANARQVLAHTKGRSEVRGGGKKPWRQKGTGRARHGSIRSPLWRGGGITFGPTKERNFAKRTNKKVKKAAMRMVLSDRVAQGNLIVIDELAFEQVKTAAFAKMKNALPCGYRRAVVVTDQKSPEVLRMTNNLQDVDTTFVGELGVLDVVNHPCMIVSKKAVQALEAKYTK